MEFQNTERPLHPDLRNNVLDQFVSIEYSYLLAVLFGKKKEADARSLRYERRLIILNIKII